MTRSKPPPPERGHYRLFDMLSPEAQRVMASLMGNLVAAEPGQRRIQLECLTAIDRLMRLPPGRLAQWPEEMLAVTETEDA